MTATNGAADHSPAPGPGEHPWPAGVILAGGRSSRFGSNKALAHHRGQPLIVHVATTLDRLFNQRLLVTNEPQSFAFVGWPMTADRISGAGPLAGIQAALHELDAERLFVTACDMPLLDGEIIARLCNCPGDWDVVLPALATGREPLHAVYHRRILPQLEAALARGDYRIADLLAELRVREMSGNELGIGAGKSSSFVNINYRRDLENLATAPLSWLQARRLILEAIQPDQPETIPLTEALDRIPAQPVRARLAVPSFPQSCRDGYALRAADCTARQGATVNLQIKGEIAAGTPPPAKLQAGESYRIMTGGLVPPGADTVVPFEEIQHQERQSITLASGCRPGTHIRPPGSELGRGRVVVRAGRVIAPEHLARLATAGCEQLAVYPRPRVGILCTGSELLTTAT
ncbi:MAG: NTP transferase domain-containing protein, partial [Desulfurivibrio sp.]|nr:NTP transferase domain-containing protein [Desulfurivibrio sp.]